MINLLLWPFHWLYDVFFILNMESNTGFNILFKRKRHMRYGHNFEGSKLIEKLKSENHPHSDENWIYTINLRECECGLIYQDAGLEYRDKGKFLNHAMEKCKINIAW